MDKEDSKTLQHISSTLDEMLAVMKKPENRFERILNIIGAIVGILAIFETIDFIINLFGG